MLTVLIDRDGLVWDSDAASLRREFGAHCGTQVLVEFLVRNLGFLRFQLIRDTCTIKTAPARLTFKAYATVCRLLEDQPPRRISLSWYDQEWQHRIYGDVNSALSHLLGLTTEARRLDNANYLTRKRSLDSLSDDDPLKQVLDLWQETAGSLEIERYPTLFHDLLSGKFVVLDRHADTSRLLFARIGEGLEMYHKGWSKHVIGAPVEDQPDVRYAHSVANCWRNAMIANRPQLHDVDAIVHDPSVGHMYRANYSRLTVPIIDRHGQARLLSTSLTDRSIDLRVEIH